MAILNQIDNVATASGRGFMLETKLGRLTFIRQIYRRLLEKGRTYAAFERQPVFKLTESLATNNSRILDPMSGYGTLMSYCAELGIDSFSVELNPPAFYWQTLINPNHNLVLTEYVNAIKQTRELPKQPSRVCISEDWFCSEARDFTVELYYRLKRIAETLELKNQDAVRYTLAVLLPFVGRFATYRQGNIVIDAKPGGMCVYEGWESDFESYLQVLGNRFANDRQYVSSGTHINILGDCRKLDLSRNQFTAFITSPAYPNYKDYRNKIFALENAFLDILKDYDSNYHPVSERPIGTIEVRNRKNGNIDTLVSKTARNFLEKLAVSKGGKKARSDIKNYYSPYFLNYFSDLQEAYENILNWMSNKFVGYVIVVNNTARGISVPLEEFTSEFFKSKNICAEINDERERSHVGTINPRIKGFRARHKEYIIKVSKSNE